MRIAVTGAGGRIGSQVVELLAQDESHQVVALTRGEPVSLCPPERVATAVADYRDPGSLRAGLDGVDTLVFVSSDGPVAQVIVHHDNVIRAAEHSGVGHIVALSGLDADVDSPFCYGVSYAYTERLLRDRGCAISIVRASIYTEFFLGLVTSVSAGGQLRLPAGDGRISLVSRGDVARCLAALATAPATGRCHDITGPESLAVAALAAIAGREWRTPLEYVEVAPAEFCSQLAGAGEDPWWTYAYSTMFDSIRAGRWAAVSEEVLRLTGRPPVSARSVVARRRTR